MTDGCDTVCKNDALLEESVRKLKSTLSAYDHPVIVHSVGFSRGAFIVAQTFGKKHVAGAKSHGDQTWCVCLCCFADHDFKFMSRLMEAGTEAGMYRYCQPNDGPEALRAKLGELFQYISEYVGPISAAWCAVQKNSDQEIR